MRFTKMHGLGNDYIYVNFDQLPLPDLSGLAVRMSRPHYGVGADGLIAIGPSAAGDFSMTMYNADGSRGEMCGNGIRCLGKYVFDKGLTRKDTLEIETSAGPRRLWLHPGPRGVETVTVDMGSALLSPEKSISVEGFPFTGVPVSVGNPHFVIFCPEPEAIPLLKVGPLLECHPAFPGRTNVEFVSASPGGLRLRVWERGSGETQACGTGACAAFAAARQQDLCGEQTEALLPGGALSLRYDNQSGHIFMTGPAVTVFEGDWLEET